MILKTRPLSTFKMLLLHRTCCRSFEAKASETAQGKLLARGVGRLKGG